MKPLVLFDFDGTIIDSVDAIIDAANALAEKRGYKQGVSREQLRGTPIRTVVRKMKVPFWRIPKFIKLLYQELEPRVANLHLHPHIGDTLEWLPEQADLGIVTGNSPGLVTAFLKAHELLGTFPQIEGNIVFAKNRRINRIRKSYGVPKHATLYVGDETRDIHSARRAGIESIAVTWGVNSEAVLKRARPTMLARTGDELDELLRAWLQSRTLS